MNHFILKRRYFEKGTYSYLYRENGSKVCCFVELEWLNNQPFKSCVPEGDYQLIPHQSPKYGECYALISPTLGVTLHGPSIRTECLIHPANKPSQLAGCAAPGTEFGLLDGEWCVTHSVNAFKALMEELDGVNATLTITKG